MASKLACTPAKAASVRALFIAVSWSISTRTFTPRRAAASLSPEECERLVVEVKEVLERAIRQGGTTLKDFTRADGRPGYFVQELQVYGRAGQGCVRCGHPLETLKLGQRTTVYCPVCQR